MLLQENPPHRFTCSRAGCTAQARWFLQWRNPRIHAVDTEKTWLACEEHLEYLRNFLEARDFPLRVAAIGEIDG